MPITTLGVGAAVTPAIIKTYLSHYTSRKERHQKPTAHISYDEGLHLVRSFLDYASHHTVEDLQAFTQQWVPTPTWVRTEDVIVPADHIGRAAELIIAQLGPAGVEQVGGEKWWQWRRKNAELKAEWIEMRADYNARKQLEDKCRRVMLYVHGGAYFFGSVDEHRYQMQRHARKLKAKVFSPRYRLAPQFPFPCGLLDCLATYLYLLTIQDHTEIVLAGDSAGGGMIISMMCIMRDQGIPLPAGAILISPWVDLTHSFPSVAAENHFDYIPAHGFMHKPSASWPPPNDDEMEAIKDGVADRSGNKHKKLEKKEVDHDAVQGFAEINITDVDGIPPTLGQDAQGKTRMHSTIPGPERHLSIEMDGKLVILKDQIQMYTTNQLISHPLVSPVLQPSLGGLSPMLILTGGGEILRDEQIYLAHKAAHPLRFGLAGDYRDRYDPDDQILHKYKPTPVQLQVWDDLCHVAPTLSFTRPAKFMYRSVAQFGAWALARAQKTTIELLDDDEISLVSSSNSETSLSEKDHKTALLDNASIGLVGKAGDPLPNFKNHMIRQRIDRHGNVYPLAPASEFAALKLAAEEVGVIKVGPVKKWMEAKREWDNKYARTKRRVQKKRIRSLQVGEAVSFDGEEPPPSALAGRRKEEDLMIRKPKKNYGLAMWSGWGSKHDAHTVKREEAAVRHDEARAEESNRLSKVVSTPDEQRSPSRSRAALSTTRSNVGSRSRSRRRTILVQDSGQLESLDNALQQHAAGNSAGAESALTAPRDDTDESRLTPMFMPKWKTVAHLRGESRELSDSASVKTGYSQASNVVPDNASNIAVIGAAGISKQRTQDTDRSSPSTDGRPYTTMDEYLDRASMSKNDDKRSLLGGHDTPGSRRSLERLRTNQVDMDGTSTTASRNVSISDADALQWKPNSIGVGYAPPRTSSSMAVARAEGVIDGIDSPAESTHIVEQARNDDIVGDRDGSVTPKLTHTPGIGKQKELDDSQEKDHDTPPRPGMYERTNTEYQTAMEIL